MPNLRARYFPFTDICPGDGLPCLKNKCKYLVDENICWYDEFGSMVEKMFNCNRYDFINYKTELKYVQFPLHILMFLSERKNFNTPPQIFISIGLNSRRLAEKLKEKFNLKWDIQGGCGDGAHELIMRMPASHLEKNELENLFTDIKNLMPKLIIAAKEINTCNLCKEHAENLTEYEAHAVCYKCEKRIIIENLPNYFKN